MVFIRRLHCITNPGSIGSSQALGRYEVSVQNNCNQKIWVAIHAKGYDTSRNGSSSLSCDGCKKPSDWFTNGWWALNPGQKAFIATTRNRTVYFSAHTSGRRKTWGNSSYRWNVRGKSEKFFAAKMSNSFSKWTQSFSCN